MKNFWQGLPKPFWVLAPMEDVTDTVFRRMVASVGRPHVFFTEFTNVEGILSRGSAEVTKRLRFTEEERPIVAQIWGNNPDSFYKSARIIVDMKFDGIDINFGCPVKNIAKQDACSALIGKNTQVAEIIAATREGAGKLPVSVKTRLGIKKIITEDWIGFLLTQQLAAIAIHGRTAAEMSQIPAHWDEIGKTTRLPNPSKALIIGNGDVKTLKEAQDKVREFHVDGVMIGRGVFDNVGVFADRYLSPAEKIDLLKTHVRLYEQVWGETKNFQILKKFVKTYICGFDGAAEKRQTFMQATSSQALLDMLSLT